MSSFTFDSSSVQAYITILQNVIARMATNSTACKTWCITLVSAVIVIVADKGKPTYVWISILPIVLFSLLDAYYLLLEKEFRNKYNGFIKKVHNSDATIDDMFIVVPASGVTVTTIEWLKAFKSISVWPFYFLLLVMLIVVKAWILK